jgi:hypothetical protein
MPLTIWRTSSAGAMLACSLQHSQAMISHTGHGGSVLANYPGTLSVPRLVTRHSIHITCHLCTFSPLVAPAEFLFMTGCSYFTGISSVAAD